MFRVRGSVKQRTTVFRATRVEGRGPTATEVQQRFEIDFMVFINDLLRGDALCFGGHGDGCAMFIRARNHQHAVAHGPFESVLDVGRQIATCNVTEMERAVSVGPCNANKDVFSGHDAPPSRANGRGFLRFTHPVRIYPPSSQG